MLDLYAIKARHAAATAGPWEVYYELNVRGAERRGVVTNSHHANGSHDANVANLTFIAAAHADIPALVAEVERLRAGIAQIASDLDDEDQFCQAVAALLRGVLEAPE